MDGANYIFSTETMCVFTICVFLHAANLESHRRKQNKKNKTKQKTEQKKKQKTEQKKTKNRTKKTKQKTRATHAPQIT